MFIFKVGPHFRICRYCVARESNQILPLNCITLTPRQRENGTIQTTTVDCNVHPRGCIAVILAGSALPPSAYQIHIISPWKTSSNPHYAEAAAASSAWGSASQEKLDIFERTGGALLAAYSHSTADVEGLRTACDFINLLYAIDELTDG